MAARCARAATREDEAHRDGYGTHFDVMLIKINLLTLNGPIALVGLPVVVLFEMSFRRRHIR